MSLLRETLESGKFAVTTEMAPPKGTDLSHLIECAKPLVGRVHAANVTDFQSAVMRTTSLATCKLLKDVGLEPVLQMTGRDRNRIAIQGEMLSAGVFGIKNMLALTGDHTVVGDHPQAKGVFDLDCIGILQTAETLMGGKDLVGNELKGSPEFYLGASEFRKLTKHMDCKVLAGIVPLKSPGMAKFMTANVPGIFVPDEQIERLRAVGKENWVSEGIKMAGEFIRQLKEEDLCDGVHIMAIGAEENVPAILDEAGL